MKTSSMVGISTALLLGVGSLSAMGAARTFVASNGLDSNACTRTAPCRTLQRAHNVTNQGGELIVLDSEGYGRMVINRSISVIAPEGVHAGVNVVPGFHGIVINAPDRNVTLRGLTVQGFGGEDGIRIENAGTVIIHEVTVTNTGNDSSDAGINVVPGASVSRLSLKDTAVLRNTGSGIRVQANTTLLVEQSRIEANGNSGILGEAPGGRLTVANSLLSGNGGIGIGLNASAAGTWEASVSGSTIDGNTFAGVSAGNGNAGIYRLSITDNVLNRNSAGVFLASSSTESMNALVGNNRIFANKDSGIFCRGSATTLVAERNDLVANGKAFDQGDGCVFESMGNNAAQNNAEADTGTITRVSPR